MGVSSISPSPKATSLNSKIKKWIDDYGIIALIVLVIGTYSLFIWRVNDMIVRQAEKQAEANLAIGKLQGQVETILNRCK